MKSKLAIIALALLPLSAMASEGYIWGVRLVNRTIDLQKTGTGVAAYSYSVYDGGESVGQMTTASDSTMFGSQYLTSTASVSASLVIQTYWLGPIPPATLYIDEVQAGSVNCTAALTFVGSGVEGIASATSTAGATSVQLKTLTPGSLVNQALVYKKASPVYSNRQWTAIGSIGGVTLWQLSDGFLLGYTPPSVAVAGSTTAFGPYPGNVGTSIASSTGNAGLGLGYTVSTLPWPATAVRKP